MRVVIQRVSEASVTIENQLKSTIDKGLLILLGIEDSDNTNDIEWLCNKIVNMRIFDDTDGRMNFSIKDINGSILLISQFTLFAETKKGNRPSYIRAAKPAIAIALYEQFIRQLEVALEKPIATGEFGADMRVQLINNGPVTICMDSKDR